MESWPPRSLLEDVGIHDRGLRNRIAEKGWQEPHNELILLLSSFLPLKGNPNLFYHTPIWTSTPLLSPLHFFEGRVAFMERLKERLDQGTNHKAWKTLKRVSEELERLAKEWKNDFYDNWQDSVIEASGNDDEKLKLIESCHGVFVMTTRYFQGHGLEENKHRSEEERKLEQKDNRQGTGQEEEGHDWNQIHEGRTRYIDLVAGHTILVFHAVAPVVDTFNAKRQTYPGGEERRKAHREKFAFRNDASEVGVHVQYHLAQEYVSRFKHNGHGVIRHLRDKGVVWHDDEIEGAWWVLILRGIAWDMCTTGDPGVFRRPRH